MPPLGFEPTISAGERLQTYILDRTDIETGSSSSSSVHFMLLLNSQAVNLYFQWQSDWKMSSFESNCSMKERRRRKRRRNRRRSGQVATKTKAAARTSNTTVITRQKKNNSRHLLCEPNLRNKYATETCRIFYMRLLRLRPALPTCIPHAREAIIKDLITQVGVQMLWLLCPKLSQSRNDHSVEKVVVSRRQNTPVLLRTEK